MLYKIVGHGLAELALRKPGEALSCLGPIGSGFAAHAERPRTLMIGGGVGIPPLVFLAETLAADRRGRWKPLRADGLGAAIPVPNRARRRSTCRACRRARPPACRELEDLGVPNRLASLSGFPGCHAGYVTELARTWLASLAPAHLAEVELFACGPAADARSRRSPRARASALPCQVSLEENMACGVGGCAGCTVLVQTPDGPAMKRICVDGPVFDAATVFTPDHDSRATNATSAHGGPDTRSFAQKNGHSLARGVRPARGPGARTARARGWRRAGPE